MLYGRDAERDEIGALLRGARDSRSGTLVVRGEPGIGKTALLEDTRDRATAMQVLTAHPVESESELPFAAVHQLFRPVLGQIERLPPPQAAALRVALGLEDGTAPERFLVFAACLSLLSELADRRPVLCIVDDAQWLDTASAEALLFVARRLDAEGIVMLFAAREGDVRRFDARDIPSLQLAGLDTDAASTLLARAAREAIALPVVDRLVAQSHGNALALMELPTALTRAQLAGDEPLPETLPLTDQVESIFLERVRRLPEDSQRVLLIAAADDSQDLAVVTAAAAGLGEDGRALDVAERAGLLSVHGTRLEFRHPLVRSAVYGAATSSERRSAHGALAAAIGAHGDDADRRAWHLAASVLEHDQEAVQALEWAAERAQDKGGHMAAAKAFERAARLAADDEERGRLLVGAARCAAIAGSDDQAVVLATQASPLVEHSFLRAEIARALALAQLRRGRTREATPLLLEAAREISSSDPAKALDLLLDATLAATDSGDPGAQVEVCALAAMIQRPEDDVASAFAADFLIGLAAIAEGDLERAGPLLENVLAHGSSSENPRDVMWAGAAAMWLGDDRQATSFMKRAATLARAQGAIGILIYALGTLALQDFLEQRFDEAALAAAEAAQFARDVDAVNPLAMCLGMLAGVAAVRGDDEEARRQAEEGLAHATASGHRMAEFMSIWALAILDLGGERWADALSRLSSFAVTEAAFTDSVTVQSAADRIEAAVRAGRDDEAMRCLEAFESWARSSGGPPSQPRLAWCRALLASSEAATEEYEDALRLGADARPFDLARIHLHYGEHLRRERRRADARVQLRSALSGFERLRSAPWVERAEEELRATGETTRKRDPSTFDQLTPKEIQIARLVAEGKSNKEVAAQLFLSPRTIDYHLRNVFTKLGLTSRTQLARVPLGTEEHPAAPVAAPA